MAFYIKSEDSVFEMDATVSISNSKTGKATKYTLSNSNSSSDHYTQDFDKITFSGYVSAVKFARRKEGSITLSLEDFEKGISELKNSGKFFSCSFSDNLPIKKNCLFENLTISRDTDTSDKSIKVDFSVVQVLVASQSEITSTPIAASLYKDVVEESKKSGAATTEATKKEGNDIAAIARSLGNNSSSLNTFLPSEE